MEVPDALAPDFRLLFDATPVPNLVLTPDFTMVAANEARLRATMMTREQIIGRNQASGRHADPEIRYPRTWFGRG